MRRLSAAMIAAQVIVGATAMSVVPIRTTHSGRQMAQAVGQQPVQVRPAADSHRVRHPKRRSHAVLPNRTFMGIKQPCPKPQSLVSTTRWTDHRLAPGVALSEGVAHDRTVTGDPGTVDMHVLRVRTTDPDVSVAPLVDGWSNRSPLDQLAANRPKLVAATNAGLFDFEPTGPIGPVFDHGRPGSIGSTPQRTVGITPDGTVESARVHLAGQVSAAGQQMNVDGFNVLFPSPGLSVYTSAWGPGPIPRGPDGSKGNVAVVVRHGHVVAAPTTTTASAPREGQLLVASSPAARRFLGGLQVGSAVQVRLHVVTEGSHSLTTGFAVAEQLLLGPHRSAPHLGCVERDTQAARTAVGFTSDRKQLILLVVSDHPRTAMHGLDHRELAKVMSDLGAAKAWEFDGSGSSEMIARMPRSGALSIRNFCADGAQRPMPVGLGVFDSRLT
ncbi:MAG TPA: phosphodiester glycosidase family protein [Mycobacteriales bacterium]|nr:phosphodiester glycosidase family protein [Mycobacteriales bacterium]